MATSTDEQGRRENAQQDEDFYAMLDVSRTASPEEIANAYRKLSRIYHPDKHTDPALKQNARDLFNKIRHAHDVLSDPMRRAVYDTLGSEAVKTSGWEVALRTKTPQDIRDEYERMAKEQEERRLQQRMNPHGLFSMEIDATDIFESYGGDEQYDDELHDYEDDHFFPELHIGGMIVRESVDAQLSTNDSMTFAGTLVTKNGRGDGTLEAWWRHIFSTTFWTELHTGVGSSSTASVKAVKTLNAQNFLTATADVQRTATGYRPGLSLALTRRLTKHVVGSLTWKEGHTESMTASCMWTAGNCNLSWDVQIGIPQSFVSVSYGHRLWDETDLSVKAKLGTMDISLTYGCQTKLSQLNRIGAYMTVGHVSGVVLKVKIMRGTQTFSFPIQLSQDLVPSAIFYGSVVPVVGFFVLKKFAVEPYFARQKKAEAEKIREANRSKIAEQRKLAEAAINLMQETYQRSRQGEESRSGLVIISAIYGRTEEVIERQGDDRRREVADVTIPLQVLVKDSRLVLNEYSKSNLPGFYDPCLGEEKSLRIRYQYRNQMYEVTASDLEAVRIPQEKHLLRVP